MRPLHRPKLSHAINNTCTARDFRKNFVVNVKNTYISASAIIHCVYPQTLIHVKARQGDRYAQPGNLVFPRQRVVPVREVTLVENDNLWVTRYFQHLLPTAKTFWSIKTLAQSTFLSPLIRLLLIKAVFASGHCRDPPVESPESGAAEGGNRNSSAVLYLRPASHHLSNVDGPL